MKKFGGVICLLCLVTGCMSSGVEHESEGLVASEMEIEAEATSRGEGFIVMSARMRDGSGPIYLSGGDYLLAETSGERSIMSEDRDYHSDYIATFLDDDQQQQIYITLMRENGAEAEISIHMPLSFEIVSPQNNSVFEANEEIAVEWTTVVEGLMEIKIKSECESYTTEDGKWTYEDTYIINVADYGGITIPVSDVIDGIIEQERNDFPLNKNRSCNAEMEISRENVQDDDYSFDGYSEFLAHQRRFLSFRFYLD